MTSSQSAVNKKRSARAGSAVMTSAVSSQSADEESSAGALSVDDISSDVINRQGATVEPVDG
ncbi:transcription factor GAMYB-like [Dorcoceras hygrometricum]|uniref:Transcription factor GAMYB-like n=1 Tax=Dorcoceras hygrometricum TaxID=472368 RepID=A0A2Z7B8E6_9LAMI|nr:transcription factor GAMYB-like [Dorcoceras hygrometricum]